MPISSAAMRSPDSRYWSAGFEVPLPAEGSVPLRVFSCVHVFVTNHTLS